MIVMRFFALLVMGLEGMAVPDVEAQELIPLLFNPYFEKRVLLHSIHITSSNQLAYSSYDKLFFCLPFITDCNHLDKSLWRC